MFYVVVLAAGLLPESRRRPAIVLLGVLLVQTAVSLIVLPFFPSPVSQLLIRGDQFGVGSRALMGFFLEPNLFGIYAVAVVGLWLSIALYMTDKRSQTYVLACVLIGSVAVFMSYTRSAWLALLLIFLILGVGVFIRPRLGGVRARRVIIALAVVIAVGYALSLLVSLLSQGESVWTLLQRGMNLVQAGSGSGEGRLRVWQTALRHWLRRPWLGWGLLSLERSNLPTSQGWLYSSVIQTLHDTGVFGLFFMLWVCVGVAWQTLKGFFGARAEIDKGMALGYLVAQGALFFTSQFSSYFWGGLTWVLFGMSVAHARLIGATTEDAEVEPAGEPRRTKSRSRGGVSP
jgi:O-antigen ligase